MAEGGDHIRFSASFNELNQEVARFKASLEEQLARTAAQGEEAQASIIRSQLNALQGAGAGREAPQIEEASQAIARENSLKRLGQQIDYETLNTIRAQTEALAAQEALLTSLRDIGAAGWRQPQQPGAGVRSSMAAQQTAAEAELASRQAYVNELVLAEGAGRERAFQLQVEQLRASAQEVALARDRARALASPGHAQAAAFAGAGGYDLGAAAAARGYMVDPQRRAAASAAPRDAPAWSAADERLVRYNIALGEYDTFAAKAELSTDRLNASITREGIAANESSNALRRHGALTTEYLQALARGETTIQEFGYQLGATTAKFAGWAAAAGATYAVLGGITEVGRGAIDTSSSVQQLTRTIDNLDRTAASRALQGLSQDTNVSMKEAGDAVFQFSRTFHDLPNATEAARQGLSALKLDNVSLSDAVKLSTSIHQQFGQSATQLGTVYNMLAAGQREYNARISETVPLLRASTGAVHNAGGDLNQLVQLSVLATRIYPGIPGQIGTAFARGAATYTPKNIDQLQQQFGLGKDAGNFTQLLTDAIRESAHLSGAQRTELAGLIFDPRYGSRISGLFGPQAAATLAQIQGQAPGPGAITPGGTQGALRRELEEQLGTLRERMHAFTNELQRLGAAVGDTGVMSAANLALRGIVSTLGEVRGVAEGFAQLPPVMKDVVLGAEALGAALLFLNRTRFGSTLADLTHLSAIPGVGASTATQTRFDLRVGTREAQQAVQADLARSAATSLRIEAQIASLERQRAAVQAEIVASATEDEELLVQSNVINARISALQRENTVVQAERNSQAEAYQALSTQQRRLRRAPSRGGFSDEEVLALGASVEEGTVGAERGLGAAEETAGRFTRFRQGITGLIGAIDPMVAGMVLFPIALGEINNAIDAANKAAADAANATHEPITSLAALQQRARDLRTAGREQSQSHVSGGPAGILQNAARGYGYLLGIHSLQRIGGDPVGGARTTGQGNELGALADLYQANARLFQGDAEQLVKTQAGRQKLYEISVEIKQRIGRALQNSGLSKAEVGTAFQAFAIDLQHEYQRAIQAAAPKAAGPSLYQLDLRMDPKKLAGQLQAYEDAQKIFGNNDRVMQEALTGYAALATEAAKSPGDDTLLQRVATAQSNYVNAVTKNVEDATRNAALATTTQGQLGDLTSALGQIQNARHQIEGMMSKFKNSPKVLEALSQLVGLIADQARQVQQQILQVMQSQAAVATSSITGISPESDLARARSDIGALSQQLAYARSHGFDAQTVNDLQNRLNTARNGYAKQQADNARSIIDARGSLTEASITGITPADDIRRAQIALDNARRLLSVDEAQGRGPAAILKDQADVENAVRALNQTLKQRDTQIRQDAASLIEAQAQLAEAQTLDPVQAAREQLGADIRILATIKPQDYKSYQEYQVAVLQQQAKVANDQRGVTSQILDTRTRTLDYELHTQQITGQEYIAGLQRLLQMHNLSQQQVQDLRTKIYDAAHSAAVNLNVGSIKLPTSYEVRRSIADAIRRGGRIPQNTGTVINHHVTNHVAIAVRVDRNADIKAFGKVLDDTLNSNFTGQAQAAGII